MARRVARGGCSLGILVGSMLLLPVEGVAAQEPDATVDAEPVRTADPPRPWRARWTAGFESSYDHNPFRLSAGQREDLVDGAAPYASLSQPYDMTNTVRVGLGVRGPGVAGRRLDLESDLQVDLYTFNRRRSSVSLDLSATQKLSKHDELRFAVGITPSEFRRNYIAGADAAGNPVFGEGIATTTDAELSYRRRLLRGKGAEPELHLELAALAGNRTYRDMPWRDRVELGGGIEADVDFGRIDVELSASHARARDDYDGAEPVLTDGGVVMAALDRRFGETRVGAETKFRLSKGTRLELGYDLRDRRYLASLADDPYYGGREDRRHTVGADLRFEVGRRFELVLGGEHQFQTTFRPGRGDTGDEADYHRPRASLRVEYRR